MGHRIERADRLFEGVLYKTKTSPELREAMTKKVEDVQQKMQAREERLRKIREEYSIDAERLATLVMRFKENHSQFKSYEQQDGVVVPAGVIANLIQEHSMIDSELEQVRKLKLVLRNLRDEELYTHPTTGEVGKRLALHELDDDELEYLGF